MEFFTDLNKIIVEKKKVTEYLLNIAHPDGGSKARYFIELGFNASKWEEFALAVKTQAMTAQTKKIVSGKYGLKIILDGDIRTPSLKDVFIRSVWVIKEPERIPILVTTYPV